MDLVTALIISNIFFLATTLFLGKELVKKFFIMRNFVSSLKHQTVEYQYPGAKALGIRPGMHKIRIRGDRPFSTLIGFNLDVGPFKSMFDWFGFGQTHGGDSHVFRTFLGNGAVDFEFVINGRSENFTVEVLKAEEATRTYVEPGNTYPPHWWQRLGYWG